MKPYFREAHLQIACARYFDARKNIIAPNISWGMGFKHECDLLVLTPSGYAYEIEIKVTKADLRADARKTHGHFSKKIGRLYYAVPGVLRDFALANIPERAGLLTVKQPTWLWAEKVRDAARTSDYQWSVDERLKLAHLGAMRIWSLLENLNRVDEEFLL
jgi:hypothetical protein